MTLDDLFRSLSYGELSNLSMSGEGSGTIVEPKHGQVIQATNDALKDMFSRLVLRESELVIRTHDFKNLYYLRKEHAMSDPTVGPLKYILDTPDDPFTGDLVKVLRVSNEIGEELRDGRTCVHLNIVRATLWAPADWLARRPVVAAICAYS